LTATQPPYRCALFDIDGTLVDTVELIVRALDHTFRKHLGVQISRDELRRTIGLPLHRQVRLFDHLVDFVPDHRAMEADEIAYYESHRHLEQVIPEAVEALKEAKRAGMRVALVTSKNRLELETFLPRLNVNGWIDAVVSSSDVASETRAGSGAGGAEEASGIAFRSDFRGRHDIRHPVCAGSGCPGDSGRMGSAPCRGVACGTS